MSDSTTPMTDQQKNGDQILEEMARANGGTLSRDGAGRLILSHPAKQP